MKTKLLFIILSLFIFFSCDSDTSTNASSSSSSSENVTKKYEVKFESNGGDKIDTTFSRRGKQDNKTF